MENYEKNENIDDIKKKYEYTDKENENNNNIYIYSDLLELYKEYQFDNLVQMNIKIKKLKAKIEEKKKCINIEIGKQNENKNENISQKEDNNIKMNGILEIEKEFNNIKNSFKEIENKIILDYVSSSRQLKTLAYNYEENININGVDTIFKNVSKEILNNTIKIFINNEKKFIILFDLINKIKI